MGIFSQKEFHAALFFPGRFRSEGVPGPRPGEKKRWFHGPFCQRFFPWALPWEHFFTWIMDITKIVKIVWGAPPSPSRKIFEMFSLPSEEKYFYNFKIFPEVGP